MSSVYTIPGLSDWALRLVAVYNCENGRFPTCIRSKVFAVAEQIAAQITYTITPFVNSLIKKNLLLVVYVFSYFVCAKRFAVHFSRHIFQIIFLRQLCIRIHVTPEEAEYIAAPWTDMETEFSAWTELLDNQVCVFF